MRDRLTYANVMATIAVFIALGGASYAATQLPKKSVGAKQLKSGSVATAKLKKEAVTAAKVKKGTLTGVQVNASTLGTVPSAERATSLTPGEAWHELGAPGQPGFESGWHNDPKGLFATVGFYKDQTGTVHFKGNAVGGPAEGVLFHLPAGFRPAAGKSVLFQVNCSGCGAGDGIVRITGTTGGADSGAVLAEGASIWLDAVSFRAES